MNYIGVPVSIYDKAAHHRPTMPCEWLYASESIVVRKWLTEILGSYEKKENSCDQNKTKRSKQSTNEDQKSLETVFSIAICRRLGDK